MQPNRVWFRGIKVIALYGVLNIRTKLHPGIALRYDRLSEALSRITAFGFFSDFEDQFADVNRWHNSSSEGE